MAAASRATGGYRPDIDGLRTVAVVPVVLFHAGTPYFTGGFVGVDVFFVISGFLITGIIAREMSEDRFSILQFYRCRVRRIFPALTLVGLATLSAGFFFLTPIEFENLGKSGATIALFSSNFYFWKSVSYFDPGLQPLLHTWSLAVEEQYYLFFPLFLLLLHKRDGWRAPALWAIFAISLTLSVILVRSKPSAAFYLLPSRAWELMLGGILALGQFREPANDKHAKIACLFGLFFILVPVFVYTRSTPFPGLAALPPAIGAALLIWGGGWGLSRPLMVAIGLISYSLYLWHLPVIAFSEYLSDGRLSTAGGLIACAASVALAGVTFRFVETPFRIGRSRALFTAAAVGMPALAAASLAIVATGGIPLRLAPQQRRQLAVMDDEKRHPSQCMTVDERYVDPANPCQFGQHPSVLLWGDSHSMITATSMQAARVPFLFAADADCPIGLGLSIDPGHQRTLVSQLSYRRCGDYNRGMLQRALRPDVKAVVLSSRWTNWRLGEPANPAEAAVDIRLVDSDGVARSAAANRAKFEHAFTALIDILTGAGKHVVIVGPVPEPKFNVPHRLFVSGFGFAPAPQPADYVTRHRVILAFLRQFESRRGVTIVWPAQALCIGRVCPTVRNGLPLFFDHDHLTVEAARSLAPLYSDLSAFRT
jgi:peptidoglycan/LPS O-acetylase OafA/YrhL